MFKAYPRHSVDLRSADYRQVVSFVFKSRNKKNEYIEKFEHAFSDYIGVVHSIAVPSARLGLFVLLKYYNYPKGSEVIITPFTHQSIFTVIKSFALKPVFVDIDTDTHNVNPELVREAITHKTKLIILTHMWGRPCDMEEFQKIKDEYALKIIEDCAMATGANYQGKKVGSFGDASIFSFGKAKAICTFGGGMLCTSDSDLYFYARDLVKDFKPPRSISLTLSVINTIIANVLTRPLIFSFTIYPIMRLCNIQEPYNPIEHKKDSEEILDEIPNDWKTNYSPFQAAVGIAQLKTLDERNNKKIENSELLNELLQDNTHILLPPPGKGLYHCIYLYYPVCFKKNLHMKSIRKRLLQSGIDTQLNELTNPEQLTVFGEPSDTLPVFNQISENLLIIPNGVYLHKRDIKIIAQMLKESAIYV